MKRKKSKLKDESVVFPIASMIDIVFLLIIFFVVTAEIDKDAQDENIVLAAAPHGDTLRAKAARSITINIRSNGEVNVAQQPVSMTELQTLVIRSVAAWGNEIPVTVRADQDVTYEHIHKVLDALKTAQIYKVNFNAEIKKIN